MAFTDIIDTALPDGGDDPAEADNNMRRIQGGFQELMDVDHLLAKTGTEISSTDSGEHRKITLRTLTPTEVAALTATKAYLYRLSTNGELYFKDDDDNTIQLTTGGVIKLTSAALLGILANNTYLTAVNAAGDGTVDLIKANASNAAVLPNGSDLATSAAPTANADIANKKYVDDQVDTQNMTPATMTGGNDSTGTVTFSNGLIRKWGKKTLSGNNTTVVFGTAFPNACFQAFAVYGPNSAPGAAKWPIYSGTPSKTQFVMRHDSTVNLARWWAIGR